MTQGLPLLKTTSCGGSVTRSSAAADGPLLFCSKVLIVRGLLPFGTSSVGRLPASERAPLPRGTTNISRG